MQDRLYEENAGKIRELAPSVRPRAFAFMDDCWTKERKFKIMESYRNQQDQYVRFSSGRNVEEIQRCRWYGLLDAYDELTLTGILKENRHLSYDPILSWRVHSDHTRRMAMDVKPITCTMVELKESASAFGIVMPYDLEPWHFLFTPSRHPFLKFFHGFFLSLVKRQHRK